jgi:hypothetical protein
MLTDTDPTAPLIDDKVWKQALPNALSDLSRFRPRRLKIEISLVAGNDTVVLPPDFIDFDYEDFNRALKPYGVKVSVRSLVFAFEWLSAANSEGSGMYLGSLSLFEADTTYQIIDSAEGAGKEMWISPAPKITTNIKTLYHALHVVRDKDEEAEPEILAMNTVPDSLRDVLLARMCYHSLLGLASLVAGDKEASTQAMTLADRFNKHYDQRTAFAPYGRRA